MEKEKVINKIRKLLKLQYGSEKIGSEGEAFMTGFDDGLNVSLDKQIEGGKKPTQAELFK